MPPREATGRFPVAAAEVSTPIGEPVEAGDDSQGQSSLEVFPDELTAAPEISHSPEAEVPEAELIEEFLAEPRVEIPAVRPLPGDAISTVETRLGSEGLARLRARYSEVLARISETVTDAERRDQLKSQAERLNPDTWVTDAEVTAGLESYETVFESLRTVVGRRRRRRRRSPDRPRGADSQGTRTELAEPQPGLETAGEDAEMDVPDPGTDQ